ncbi:tyrosyl-tRNA synthetase [Candidatus Uzinura diaspidicola str. ASNER]|uniref:Tyrosine--tRNA ligase n=1 Tax=Candidatus Uzinura diaspidicola str. ASNER TaxID=1133592 RepID=L7VJI2_9FLAO|nr:tyrosyl-tRNA synthetase [Candidatus Uzinura diaspidicola str. ASNER]
MKDFDILKELVWRGLLCKYTLGIKEQLKKESNIIYIGFDPTSDSLHIGNLLPIFMLEHFHRFGYKSLIILGGATGMLGDPSGKYKERTLLDKEILIHNIHCIQKQLELFLNVEKTKLLNNFNWIGNLSFLNFVRDIGKNLTVNYMMAKESVKSRLKSESEGISFTEFTYQLVQAYDFYHLYTHENCCIQIGGSDQWGNIITGIELIRRLTGGNAYGITFPLITKSNGTKLGKSDNNENIWLDYRKTSPYKFYQFWLNISDEEASRFIKFYTFLQKDEIEHLLYTHNKAPYKRILQKALAKNMTKFIHGEENYKKSLKLSNFLFGKDKLRSLSSLDEKTFLSIFQVVTHKQINRGLLQRGLSILEALTENSGFFSSKGEAIRALKEKSIYINREKVDDNFIINENSIIANRYILLQKGKKTILFYM